MKYFNRVRVAGLLLGLFVSQPSQAVDWGDFKGRFVFGGTVPDRELLTINKDPEFCGPHAPKVEKLIVHKEDRGIANVIIWLDVKSGQKVETHASYSSDPQGIVRLANKGCRFDPHVCVLRPGQTLLIENPDQVDHNTAAGLDRNSPFNHLTIAGQSVRHSKFERSEKLPASIQCSIHPWMTGWLVIKDHPYVAVTDVHGRFEMKNLPAGEHTFVVWHEMSGYVQEVTRENKKETWKSGKFSITILPKPTHLGDVTVVPSVFTEAQ